MRLEHKTVSELTRALRMGDADRYFELAVEIHTKAMHSGLIKDRRYHLATYKRCFKGADLVTWLVDSGYCKYRVEGEIIGINLLATGVSRARENRKSSPVWRCRSSAPALSLLSGHHYAAYACVCTFRDGMSMVRRIMTANL